MNACVVDASVAIKWYVPEIHADRALDLLARRRSNLLTLHVPDICFAEVGNAIWNRVRRGELEPAAAARIALALLHVPTAVHPTRPLLPAALDLAVEAGRTVYDSLYVRLAHALGCPLVTADARLRNALAGSR